MLQLNSIWYIKFYLYVCDFESLTFFFVAENDISLFQSLSIFVLLGNNDSQGGTLRQEILMRA
jgi:hypothetical protein